MYTANRILLTCTVDTLLENHLKNPLSIDIKWYVDNGTENQINVGVDEPTQTVVNGDHVQITSTLALSGTSNQNAAFINGPGSYYCRVQATTCSTESDVSIESNNSQSFQVLSRDEHLQAASDCSKRNFIANVQSCDVFKEVIASQTTPSLHLTSSS